MTNEDLDNLVADAERLVEAGTHSWWAASYAMARSWCKPGTDEHHIYSTACAIEFHAQVTKGGAVIHSHQVAIK